MVKGPDARVEALFVSLENGDREARLREATEHVIIERQHTEKHNT